VVAKEAKVGEQLVGVTQKKKKKKENEEREREMRL